MAIITDLNLTGTYYGSFNASGQTQYLTAPSNAAFQFGTGDFTIEFWVKFNNVVDQQALIDMRNGTGAAVAPVIYLWTNSYLYYYTVGADRISSSQKIQAGLWYHIAVVRSSSVTTMFINGNKTGSSYTDTNNYIINSPWIGRFTTVGLTLMLSGLMSNLRIVKGTAVYTDNFIPSTSPLTNITNTSLLTLQSATVVDNGTGNAGGAFTITNVGSVTTTSLTSGAYGYSKNRITNVSGNDVNSTIISRKNVILIQNSSVNNAFGYDKLTILGNSREDWSVYNPLPLRNQYYVQFQQQFWS